MSKLCFPTEILDQHLVVLGKTGAGKSSALRHIVEHLFEHKKRVCVIDPKGDWWGLKSSANGKSAGYPVVAFGDFKNEKASDVPINAQSGRHVAELITSGNRPAMIGFRGWMTSHMVQFWIDFASGIFNANSGELYLVGDEFHNFAPKGKIMDPQAGKCLHWSNRLLSEGRGLGIVCLIASQRPQKVHNDTLTSCETLVAMRVVHAADRAAVEDWIKGCGDKEQGRDILNRVAGMERGEAFVWSPEVGFGPKRIKFPMFETFDSFAPPQLQSKISKRGWADVDLNEVKEKMARVIEEAKANDPRELKKQLAHLKTELSKKPQIQTETKVEVQKKEVFVLKDSQIDRLEKFSQKLTEVATVITETIKRTQARSVEISPNQMQRVTRTPNIPLIAPRPKMAQRDASNGSVPSGGIRRIMIALAQRPGSSTKQVAVRAGLSSSSGSFSTYLSKLRTSGWIEGDKHSLGITPAGIEALGDYNPLPQGRDLYEHWRTQLGSGGASRMLQVLFEAYPDALTKEEVGERSHISSSSGSFSTYLSKLRTLELIRGKSELRASDELFT